jgi:hypothetical protein
MFGNRGKATSAIMAGMLAVGMVASALSPVAVFAANEASVGVQTGSGKTDLTMVLRDTAEHGGTAEPEKNPDGTDNPLYNPDADGDGLGDNIAFTVPSSLNYIVDADGTMTGPTNATIQNHSAMGLHVSSVDVDEQTPFKIVSDASVSSDSNSVDLLFGPAADQLNAASYLTKANVNDAAKWNMTAEGATGANLGIQTNGHVSHVAQDITQQSKFGTIKWYVSPGEAHGKVNASYSIGYKSDLYHVDSDASGLTVRGTKVINGPLSGDISESLGVSDADWSELWDAIFDGVKTYDPYWSIFQCGISGWNITVDGVDYYAGTTWESAFRWDDELETEVPADLSSFEGKNVELSAELSITT